MRSTPIFDAIIIGAGPSGLGASLALSGWQPRYKNNCAVDSPQLSTKLRSLSSPLAEAVRDLAGGLRGRSHNPAALLYDALQHPGVDRGVRGQPSCLELVHDPHAALSHVILDTNPIGGAWHQMHEATTTLSPGFWMELPGYSLADHGVADPYARQPRRVIAQYYQAAAERFDVSRHHRAARATSVRWLHAGADEDGKEEEDGARWEVALSDGTPALRSRALILAVGTWGVPRRLGIRGEGLPIVSHRCGGVVDGGLLSAAVDGSGGTTDEGASGEEAADGSYQKVLVVGAGLSAADCIIHHLKRGRHVMHAWRGLAQATKITSKFGSGGASGMYPEYYALSRGMEWGESGGRTERGDSPSGRTEVQGGIDGIQLLGGIYQPLAGRALKAIESNGRCVVVRQTSRVVEEQQRSEAMEQEEEEEEEVTADRVTILIGSDPDYSFLPAEVLNALAAAGKPPDAIDGVRATHEVFVDVDPYSFEARAWPGLHALGPLRGDNFVRFAIHDGHGVAAELRSRRSEEVGGGG